MEFSHYYGKHKQRNRSVIQEPVKPKLELVAFRDYPEKTKIIEAHAKHNNKTYSDVIRELTDQAVEIIRGREIEGI